MTSAVGLRDDADHPGAFEFVETRHEHRPGHLGDAERDGGEGVCSEHEVAYQQRRPAHARISDARASGQYWP
jgi:hypothetical protein